MILIPFKRIVVISSMSPSEIVERLLPRVASKHSCWPFLLVGKFDFMGQVSETQITLIPVIRNSNTYLPKFKGKILALDSWSRIEITAMPTIAGIVIMIIAFVGSMILTRRFVSMIVGFLAVHIGTCLFGFAPLVEKTEMKLRELLNDNPKH